MAAWWRLGSAAILVSQQPTQPPSRKPKGRSGPDPVPGQLPLESAALDLDVPPGPRTAAGVVRRIPRAGRAVPEEAGSWPRTAARELSTARRLRASAGRSPRCRLHRACAAGSQALAAPPERRPSGLSVHLRWRGESGAVGLAAFAASPLEAAPEVARVPGGGNARRGPVMTPRYAQWSDTQLLRHVVAIRSAPAELTPQQRDGPPQSAGISTPSRNQAMPGACGHAQRVAPHGCEVPWKAAEQPKLRRVWIGDRCPG